MNEIVVMCCCCCCCCYYYYCLIISEGFDCVDSEVLRCVILIYSKTRFLSQQFIVLLSDNNDCISLICGQFCDVGCYWKDYSEDGKSIGILLYHRMRGTGFEICVIPELRTVPVHTVSYFL